MAASQKLNADELRPECIKLQLFRRTIDSIVKGILRDIDERVMQECYGKLLDKNPVVISKIHSRFINYVETEVKEKIGELIVEENLNAKFLKLQELEGKFCKQKVQWRPSRNVLNDIRSHDCMKEMQLKQELEVLIEKEERDVEQLMKTVEEGRKEAFNLQDTVSNMNDFSSKLDSCNEEMKMLIENIIADLKPN